MTVDDWWRNRNTICKFSSASALKNFEYIKTSEALSISESKLSPCTIRKGCVCQKQVAIRDTVFSKSKCLGRYFLLILRLFTIL